MVNPTDKAGVYAVIYRYTDGSNSRLQVAESLRLASISRQQAGGHYALNTLRDDAGFRRFSGA